MRLRRRGCVGLALFDGDSLFGGVLAVATLRVTGELFRRRLEGEAPSKALSGIATRSSTSLEMRKYGHTRDDVHVIFCKKPIKKRICCP